jgi:hypothetical protein
MIAGLLGPPIAAVMLLWPAQTDRGLLSYPFTHDGFLVAQACFFAHHIGMVILLIGFARSGAFGSGWLVRAGAWLATVGMVLLTVAELNTMRYADWTAEKANAGAMGATYGIACNTIGLGLIIAGVGVARARAWSGWHRWMPLVIGIATFVELTPGMFGGFVIARLAIGFWIALFAALGASLRIESKEAPPSV